jgi:hypothetical protein
MTNEIKLRTIDVLKNLSNTQKKKEHEITRAVKKRDKQYHLTIRWVSLKNE